MVTLGRFRELTAHLPDDALLIVEPEIVVEAVEIDADRVVLILEGVG